LTDPKTGPEQILALGLGYGGPNHRLQKKNVQKTERVRIDNRWVLVDATGNQPLAHDGFQLNADGGAVGGYPLRSRNRFGQQRR
jgi:hypothetical protein